jgi:hypothetical protein
MASQPRSRERAQGRRLKVWTLLVASVASLTAALVTSRLWIAGTPLAAAATPVIVALVSELLERPAVVVGRRLTADRPALLSAPHGQAGSRADAGRGWAGDAPVTIYGRRRLRRRLALGAVVATGMLGFAVAAAAMTLPELVAGRSLGQGDRQTTLFGGEPRAADDAAPTTTGETATETETTPTSATETTNTEAEMTPAPQRESQYQSETPQTAPNAQPTETVPSPTETYPGP